MPHPDGNVALTLGLLLTAALLSGLVAERFRLPKVTAYLLVGLLRGPYTLESLPEAVFALIPKQLLAITTIPESHLAFLDPMAKFAMGLVLFNMGCSFSLRELREHAGSIFRLSLGEITLTFVLVSVGLLVLRENWQAALLFGALAIATAPATTVLVLKENHSEGPITQYANTLVALNNIASIIAFEILFVGVLILAGNSSVSWLQGLGELLFDLTASAGIGFVAGLLATVGCSLLGRGSWLVLLVGLTTALLGVCQHFGLPYLLMFLVMGATVANASDRVRYIVAHLDNLTRLLCVVFFVIHGTEMHIRALITAGMIGVGYVVLRSTGKYFGIFLSARHQDGESVKHWLGASLMAQAGAAISLSSIAAARYPELGIHLRDVILGTVVVFEIAGPILIRQAVVRGGEVPLDTAIHHHGTTLLRELRSLGNRLFVSLGFQRSGGAALKSLTIADLMRPARGIPASATFQRVVDFIEKSHDDTLPVIDESGILVGMISYHELKEAHFDPGLGHLVRASDLALHSVPILRSDQPLADAWGEFQQRDSDCLPVVSASRPHRLVGIIRRDDVMRLT